MEGENHPGNAFHALSDEYAQAVEALDAIEKQAELFVAAGRQDELRSFLDRFVQMARSAGGRARAQNLDHFTEWFDELIKRVENVQKKAFT